MERLKNIFKGIVLLVVILLLCSTTLLYAVDGGEMYATFGPSFKNRFDITGDAIHSPGSSKGAAGLNFNFFGFWNESNAGLFIACNNLIPIYVTSVRERDQITSYSGSNMPEVGIGVGFRRVITSRLSFLGGAGLDSVCL
jgi:hypothetical protein